MEANVLLLFPSMYNKIWEYINVKEVAEYMEKEYTQSKCPDLLFKLLIKLLLRSTNFSDLVLQ